MVRKGDKVTIMMESYRIGPGNYYLPGFTMPYQMVVIDKIGEWSRDIHFVVDAKDWPGYFWRGVHFIP